MALHLKDEIEKFVNDYYTDKGYTSNLPVTYNSLLVDNVWHITTKVYTSQIDTFLSRVTLSSTYPNMTEEEAVEQHKELLLKDLEERRLEEQIALTATQLQGGFTLYE